MGEETGEAHARWVEERCLASGGKLYTESPMVSAGGSQPPMNPWVSGSPTHLPPLVPSATSVVPSPVCKPLVTAGDASASAADPVEEFALCFHDSGRPAGQALNNTTSL